MLFRSENRAERVFQEFARENGWRNTSTYFSQQFEYCGDSPTIVLTVRTRFDIPKVFFELDENLQIMVYDYLGSAGLDHLQDLTNFFDTAAKTAKTTAISQAKDTRDLPACGNRAQANLLEIIVTYTSPQELFSAKAKKIVLDYVANHDLSYVNRDKDRKIKPTELMRYLNPRYGLNR